MADEKTGTVEDFAAMLAGAKPEPPVEPQPDAASEQPAEPEQLLDPIVGIFARHDEVKRASNLALIELLHPSKGKP